MEKFAQFIPLNVQEIFTWYMEQKDVENPERFIQTQNTIPLEVQQQLLQDPKIQAICEAYQQGVRVPSQAEQPQPNNIPDAAIPQAEGEV